MLQIVSSWRSGSTFVGEVLSTHPAAFYHYEPLLHLLIKQVRTGRAAKDAVALVRALFDCDYRHLGKLINIGSDFNVR